MDDPAVWSQGSEPDVVRPFVMTGGRTRSSRADVRMETMVELADEAGTRPSLPEQAAIVEACQGGPISVAEVSAHTALPLGVTTILIGDLLDTGVLEMHLTDPTDIEVSALTRMIERVKSL